MPKQFIPSPKVNLLRANQANGVESGILGTDFTADGGGVSTLVVDTTKSWQGQNSIKVVTDGAVGNQGIYAGGPVPNGLSIKAGTTYTLSAYVQGSGTVYPCLAWHSTANVNVASIFGSVVTLTGGWQRISVTSQAPIGAAILYPEILTSTTQAITFWTDGWQVEKGSTPTKWVLPDGVVTQPNPFANLVPLFNDAAWTKHANATVSPDGRTLTLNATAAFQYTSTGQIVVAPITAINVKALVSRLSGAANAQVLVQERDAGGNWVSDAYGTLSNADVNATFTTSSKTRSLQVWVTSNGVGTFTFSDLTLRTAQPVPQAANFQEFFKELVTNGDFSQGAVGWTLMEGAVVSNGVLTFTTTGNFMNSTYQRVPVTPYTSYRITADATGTITLPVIKDFHSVVGKIDDTFMSGSAASILAQSGVAGMLALNTNSGNKGAGTYTFDNISLKRVIPT